MNKTYYLLLDEFSDYDEYSFQIIDIFTDPDEALDSYFEIMLQPKDGDYRSSYNVYQWDKELSGMWWDAGVSSLNHDKHWLVVITEYPREQEMADLTNGGETAELALERITRRLQTNKNYDKKKITVEYRTWEEMRKILKR